MEIPTEVEINPKYEYKLLISLKEKEEQVNKRIRSNFHSKESLWIAAMTCFAEDGMWYYTFGDGILPYIEKKVVSNSFPDCSYQNKRAWAFLATLKAKESTKRDIPITRWRYLVSADRNTDRLTILENRLYLNETLLSLLE